MIVVLGCLLFLFMFAFLAAFYAGLAWLLILTGIPAWVAAAVGIGLFLVSLARTRIKVQVAE